MLRKQPGRKIRTATTPESSLPARVAWASTLAAVLVRLFADEGHNVLAADEDPQQNLIFSLGHVHLVVNKVRDDSDRKRPSSASKTERFSDPFAISPLTTVSTRMNLIFFCFYLWNPRI
jgi:hypothetical protein